MKLPLIALSVLLTTGACQKFQEFAKKHAPYLRFHYQQGSDGYCFPHNASDYYNARKKGDKSRLCNLDYDSVHNGLIPTYWHAQVCMFHLHIAYWSFFGYNNKCDAFSGERNAYWESLVVKIRDWDLDPRMHEVRFSQKSGFYTRIPGHYKTMTGTHPVVYVGKANHGFYHDSGGSNTCCYFEDTRNPGSSGHYMETWMNLVELRNDTEAWMQDPDTAVWNGLKVPTLRPDFDLCSLDGCAGAFTPLCSTSGCSKSDTGNEPLSFAGKGKDGQTYRYAHDKVFEKSHAYGRSNAVKTSLTYGIYFFSFCLACYFTCKMRIYLNLSRFRI